MNLNLVSDPNVPWYKRMPDFGGKNIALILGVAAVLGILAINERPFHLAAVTNQQNKVAETAQKEQVLGASTVDPKILAQFKSISVTTTEDNSKAAFLNYIQQVSIIQQGDSAAMLAADGGVYSGAALQPDTVSHQNKLIADLQNLAVPSALADYDRMLIGYYTVIFESDQGQYGATGAAVVSVLSGELDKYRASFSSSAGVQLP